MKKEMVSSRYLPNGPALQKITLSSWLTKNLIIEIISSLLIILFIYSSLTKLLDYDRFTVQLSKSPFITSFSNFVAWSIPTSEILIALCLAFKRTRLIGLYASFFLMSLFTAYLIIMLNFSYYIPCSCGGVLEKLSWDQHILFNSFFILIAGLGVILKTDHTKNIYA
ncbi:MAG TPA: MauE/DoxX family redox-associated membrane protein [Segetibacter sp.]|nr:MauE/DoxX family redox-associated membrane protein [Segetibacter sp.]